ncbi:MAG TPA: hypothetical protein VE817_12110 [Candidatus Acidoferrum sp.]|nr:hypothetical protein [Candidatus Acidoferrum sp.]
MRHSNQAGGGRRLPIWALGLLALAVVSCGPAAAASAPPAPVATPLVTPDPHLTAPVTADDIFRDFGKGGLKISSINANLGMGNPAIVKQINANLGGWPLRITQYQSASVMTKALDWQPGQPPGPNETPYSFAALNILVQFGPMSTRPPTVPDAARQKDAAAIVALLDPLLWPIAQRSVVAIPSRTPTPAATPTPTAKPTAKPTPRPSSKATRTPKPSKAP